MSLRFHLAMCRACRECDRQFGLLHEAGRRLRTEIGRDEGKIDDQDSDGR